MPESFPEILPPSLFGGQLFYGHHFPIYAWKLWTGPTAMIRSQDRPDGGESFAFLAANANIAAVIWYHLYPYKDWAYGEAPGTPLVLPDGTSRNWVNASQTALANLIAKLNEEENLWPPGLGAPTG